MDKSLNLNLEVIETKTFGYYCPCISQINLRPYLQSPVIPTLSAITAGFLGSSSGIPPPLYLQDLLQRQHL